jgi:nucleoside-diphosphate-sugar epimerase
LLRMFLVIWSSTGTIQIGTEHLYKGIVCVGFLTAMLERNNKFAAKVGMQSMAYDKQRKTALVTGANGFIGNAVAKAFSAAGWRTFGLIRQEAAGDALAREEIIPIVGNPTDRTVLDSIGHGIDVFVSNTEDRSDPAGHLRDVGALVDEIGRRSEKVGIRPLVMFSSGCKDYGAMTERDGDPALAPHTEVTPVRPPLPLTARANFGKKLLEAPSDLYDAVVLRPTIVYGHGSSLYGLLFDLASKSRGFLEVKGHPRSIMHSLHVDDCARAYVALAEHEDRNAVARHAFNLSGLHYETTEQVAGAIADSYDLDLRMEDPPREVSLRDTHHLFNFSQWVSSEKVRRLTGWADRKPAFADSIQEYRTAYEATVRGAA